MTPYFEITIENNVSLIGLGALLVGPKERQDRCWEQFIRRCCGTSVPDTGTLIQTVHEGCEHFHPKECTQMMAVRMRVKGLSESTAKLSFDHVAVGLKRGSENIISSCERDVVVCSNSGRASYQGDGLKKSRFSSNCSCKPRCEDDGAGTMNSERCLHTRKVEMAFWHRSRREFYSSRIDASWRQYKI